AHAAIVKTARAAVDPLWIEPDGAAAAAAGAAGSVEAASASPAAEPGIAPVEAAGGRHASHAHVTALTCYLQGPVDGDAFDAMLRALPPEVYRAKGIVTFRGTGSRFLFQYAFRETDYVRLAPEAAAHDTAVFIGEGFDRNAVTEALARLAAAG